MTLLLGPPGAGKTSLLQALAGKSDRDLRVRLLLSTINSIYLFVYYALTIVHLMSKVRPVPNIPILDTH